VDGLSRNSNFNELNTIKTHWHGETYLESISKTINKDVDRLSRNSNFNELNTIKTHWHGGIDWETISS
jgi:hypothetical protein